MERTAGIALRWAGRVFILLVPYILVCSVFLPAGVQPLNRFACPSGMELDNSRFVGPNKPDNARIELVCVGGNTSVSAAKKVLLIAAIFLVLGLIALVYSSRFLHPRARVPVGPATH